MNLSFFKRLKISLPTDQPIVVLVIFVCKPDVFSESNFAKICPPIEAFGNLLMLHEVNTDNYSTVMLCLCLCQGISFLASFRKSSSSIYRHNVNSKLTDALAY